MLHRSTTNHLLFYLILISKQDFQSQIRNLSEQAVVLDLNLNEQQSFIITCRVTRQTKPQIFFYYFALYPGRS